MARRRTSRLLAAIATTLALSAPVAVMSTADAAPARTFRNCTELNKTFPHGVGMPGARDKVRGRTKPVTNFHKSKAWYQKNKKSDRDRDNVACEKR